MMHGQLRQRMPPLEVPGLTETARGQDCTLRVPGVCSFDTATTVWAHSNWDEHGKGKGLKAHDPFGCWACSACHDWLDRTRDPRRRALFDKARDLTLYRLFEQRKLQVKR